MSKIVNHKKIHIQQETTTAELQTPELGKSHTECSGIKLVC